MPVVIHPHFHFRRTGVTRHVETVVEALRRDRPSTEVRTLGAALAPQLPRLSVRELFKLLLRREPLIWHAHRNNEALVGLVLRALTRRVRVIFTRHSATPPSRFTRALLRSVDRVVALTAPMASSLGAPATVIGHGIDLQRFSPPLDRPAAWTELGLGGEHGIGVIGRIRPSKGHADFARAVSPLLEQHPGWRAVALGQIKPRDRRFARSLRTLSRERLTLLGPQPQIERWYQGLTIFVQPSHSEGYSLAILEALASGCCVVASRLEHFPELIEHGRTGFLYPTGDVEALRETLSMLMRSPERAIEIGRNAADVARRRFGAEQEARALDALYQEVLGGKTNTPGR